MAQITTIKVAEGPSSLILRVNLLSDGSGELINAPFLAASDLNPPGRNVSPSFRVLQLWYACVWFDVTLSVGTLSPVVLWTMARDCDSHIDFRSFGGLVDQNVYASPPVVDDGILMLTTNNFAPVGSQGTIVLALSKTNQVAG